MPRAPLPDPTWTEAAEVCIGCGYSLKGLPVPGRCPECGAHFEARQLILAGVPRSASGASVPRRAAWIGVFILTALISKLWPLFIAPGRWVIPLIAFGGILIVVTVLLVTGQRERHGTERFCITPSGLARVPATFDPASARLDTAFLPWSDCNAVELKRVSPFWRRLRIGRNGPRARLTEVLFDAGIRCPDAAADIVLHTIRSYLAPPTHPPTAPPAGSARI
jgi:hypothetical protein